MKPSSAKAKGREFQNWVKKTLHLFFPTLEPEDIKTAIMGEIGEDIKFSPAARRLIPYSIECKRLAKIAVYALYEQAVDNAKGHEPLLFIRADRKKALVVVDAEHFLGLVQANGNNKKD